MSLLNLPSSDLGKMATMARLLNNSLAAQVARPAKDSRPLADEATGFSLVTMIPAQLQQRLQVEVPLFGELLETIQYQRQQTRSSKENLRNGLGELSRLVRDSWAGLRRRNRRLKFPDSVNAFYLIPKARMMPVNGSRRKWLEIARSLVAGDQRAVAEGYPAMAEPNAADLQLQITSVAAQLLVEGTATSLLKRVQGQMMQQRRVIRDLHRDLAAYVRAWLGGKPGAHRRDIMRALGFNFEVSKTPNPNGAVAPQQAGGKADVVLAVSPASALPSPAKAEAENSEGGQAATDDSLGQGPDQGKGQMRQLHTLQIHESQRGAQANQNTRLKTHGPKFENPVYATRPLGDAVHFVDKSLKT